MLMKGPVALDEHGLIAQQLEDIARYIRSLGIRAEARGQPNVGSFADILGSRDYGDSMQSYIAQVGRE